MPTRLQLLLELSSPTKYLTNQHLPQQEKRSKTHENQFFVFAITIMPKNINIQNKQVAFTKTFLLNQLTQLTFKHKSNYQIYTQIFQLETLSGIFKQSIAKTNHRPQLVHKKYTPHSNPFFYYKKQQITLAKISFIIPMRAVLFRKTQKTIHTYYIIKLVSITSFRSIKQQRLKRLQTKTQNPFFVYQNCFNVNKIQYRILMSNYVTSQAIRHYVFQKFQRNFIDITQFVRYLLIHTIPVPVPLTNMHKMHKQQELLKKILEGSLISSTVSGNIQKKSNQLHTLLNLTCRLPLKLTPPLNHKNRGSRGIDSTFMVQRGGQFQGETASQIKQGVQLVAFFLNVPRNRRRYQ
eukprot:TRINITY_DN1134_c0_g1_i1.p1 TRINITY_DN1134_c0_g1~~TRINITY_DN1134_c0_g1_i1.p1  ORF type:complete len:350 (-),score=-24.13 TRINITY_DN1134_c0_g1_i1:1967-3016(-)